AERPEPRASEDPVERYIEGRTEPTARWLREHRDWITDPKKNAKLTAAHFNALGEGLQPDTSEYFEHVETFIGLKKAAEEKTNGSAKSAPQKKSGAPVAPVAASTGGTNGGGNEVRLSRTEA